MKERTRQRKIDMGITYISEAVLDVIKVEGAKTADGVVSTDKVNDALGGKNAKQWEKDMYGSALDFMVYNGDIVNVGNRSWRLNK